MRFLLVLGSLLGVSACTEPVPKPGAPKNCERKTFENNPYTVCKFAVKTDRIQLFLKHPDGALIGDFARLKDELVKDGKQLKFAMNAGMYHQDRRPVGLYVENGIKTGRLQKRASNDNFGLLPNGVLWIDEAEADVSATSDFEKRFDKQILPKYVTQSGPMLVIDGKLHKTFKPDSTSLNIRNGVGIDADKSQLYFVISDVRVNFHTFARFFLDELKTPNALYLDGSVSKLYSTDLGREDTGTQMGPIVGVF